MADKSQGLRHHLESAENDHLFGSHRNLSYIYLEIQSDILFHAVNNRTSVSSRNVLSGLRLFKGTALREIPAITTELNIRGVSILMFLTHRPCVDSSTHRDKHAWFHGNYIMD